MPNNVLFRLWNDADEGQILALVRRNYGDLDPAHSDYFDWEYRRNPLGRATSACGLLEDGTVVSFLAAVPVPVVFNGKAMTGAVLVNGQTHPDFRGQNLFSQCGKTVCRALKEAGVALSYGLPNPNSFPSLTRKIGYTDIGRACLLIRPHDPGALLSSRFPAARRLVGSGVGRAFFRAFLRKPRPEVAVTAISSFNDIPMADLREQAGLTVDNTSIDWLNWRYIGVPRRPYRLIVAGDASHPLGVAVYRITSWDSVRIGTVNDLFLPKHCSPDSVDSLMSHVFSNCEASGCAATFCVMSPASRKLTLLKRAGFWVVPSRFEPQPFSVILQGHSVSISGVSVDDMEVSFGTYDIF